MRGKIMQPVYIFLGLGILTLIGAAMIYSNSESSSAKEFAEFAKDAKDNSKLAVKACEEMKASIESFDAQLKDLQMKTLPGIELRLLEDIGRTAGTANPEVRTLRKEVEELKIRQHSMDKKIHSGPATVVLKNGPDAIQVQIVPRPAKVGQGMDSLLKKAGVTQ